MIFNDKMDYRYYYDICIYNYIEAGQVLKFEVYNVTIKIDMIYVDTTEYSNLLLFDKYKKLLATI